METLLRDLRFALRSLRSAPGFTAVALLTLALGIGANTAIFSVVNAVLFQPLPFRDAGQLVSLNATMPGTGAPQTGLSVPEFDDLNRSGIFDQISVVWPIDANVTGAAHPERVEALAVHPNYFSLLGVASQKGRLFGPEDIAQGFAEAAVISDGLWHRMFGGDAQVLGRKMLLDGDAYVIVGVLPPEFRHPGRTVATDTDVWITAGFRSTPFPKDPQRRQRFLPSAIARLRPRLTTAQAQAQLSTLSASLRRDYATDYPAKANWSFVLRPLREVLVGNVRPLMWVLLGAVALILLIGCANVANLLLARATTRQREISVRLALGASRARLVRQLLTEAMLLAGLAGLLGVLAAVWTQRALLRLLPASVPRLNEVAISGPVLVFALAATLVTGVIFGLVPALQASQADVIENLRGARGTSATSRQHRLRAAFLVTEIAFSLALLAGAGLLLRTFWDLVHVDAGFDPHHVISARIWLPVPNNPAADIYANAQQRTTWAREVLRRLRETPGVETAAITTSLPLSQPTFRTPVEIEGQTNEGEARTAEMISVTPDYFAALKTPLVSGRVFTESDQPGSQDVVILDRAAVQRFLPGQDPLGRRLVLPFRDAKGQRAVGAIVGVVGDVKYDSLDEQPTPHVYVPYLQRSPKVLGVVVRTNSDVAAVGESVRQSVQAVDPNLPVYATRSMEAVLAQSLGQRRLSAQLVGGFALVALLLAAIGVYGVASYSVAQRTHEIGIRMALGASTHDVLRLVLSQGMRTTWLGIGIGVVGALATTKLISALLFRVSARDALVLIGAAALLALVALVATLVPARRATRVDPLIALRYE